MNERASSVAHVEYEILKFVRENIDLTSLEGKMVVDGVSRKRFASGMEKIDGYLNNMMERRRHRLKSHHVDYKVKE